MGDWLNSLKKLWMTGSHSSHLNKHGRINSPPMLDVCQETSKEVTNDVVSMMKNNSHMVDQRPKMPENDVTLMSKDTTVGVKQLTTGFSKWAQRYLSQCSGQRNYQYQ